MINIDVRELEMASESMRRLRESVSLLSSFGFDVLDFGFSPITGVDRTGDIHGRAVHMDPASAFSTLEKFAGQLGWMASVLGDEAQGFDQQEDANAHGLDIADAGGAVNRSVMPLVDQPEPGYSPFSFVPPVVNTGSSLFGLVQGFLFTNMGRISNTIHRWQQFASRVNGISTEMEALAGQLQTRNQSETTDRAAAKIREVAATGRQFAANATVMAGKNSNMLAGLQADQVVASADWGKLLAIPDPAARKVVEQALLMKHQGILQNIVLQSMPIQRSLMDQAPASGGGDLQLGMGAVDGNGQRYSTEGVTLPRQIQELMNRPGVGAGSFEVAEGQISAVDGVGLDPATRQEMRDVVQRSGQWLADQGLIPTGEAALRGDQMMTQSANVAAPSAPGAVTPGASAAGGAAMPAGGLSGAPATVTPAGAWAGAPGAGLTGAGAGQGLAGGNRGAAFLPGSAFGGMTSAAPGAAGNGAAGARGALRGGLPGAAGLSGVPGGAVPGAAGSGLGAGAGAGAGAGGSYGQSPAEQANKAAAGASQNGRSGGIGRGMAPMMGMHRGGNGTKDSSRAVRAVVTEVEKDPNRRALLGQRPAVVPGVIGAWVRED